MNLKDFINETITSIVDGLKDATSQIGREVSLVGSESTAHRHIEFDVAVSVEQSGKTEGGGKIKVLSFVEAGGDKTSETKNSTISRIKFGVVVHRPPTGASKPGRTYFPEE